MVGLNVFREHGSKEHFERLGILCVVGESPRRQVFDGHPLLAVHQELVQPVRGGAIVVRWAVVDGSSLLRGTDIGAHALPPAVPVAVVEGVVFEGKASASETHRVSIFTCSSHVFSV
ncbi:hypothetical protein SDC9_207633 [bioreactor metagenome]|uniref:Uncharacterized protein n=1 Tax=bioreactor metagenome TaxID=1076179 RepID=A0A645J8F5_9ZZZZ